MGDYVNMSFQPAWQNCSDDTKVKLNQVAHTIQLDFVQVAELKKSMGWLGHNTHCVRCAVRDGWVQVEVRQPLEY